MRQFTACQQQPSFTRHSKTIFKDGPIMLLELPPTVALVGSIIGLLLFLGLSYLASFMSRHFKRIKPKAEEDSRCSTYHVGLLVTGSIMLCIGLYDAWNMQQSFIARNRLIDAPIISVALGLLSISCGSSAIFSTNENKTSIDSKILSISWLWLVAFAVWDRARPPLFNLWAMFVLTGASSATIMIFPDSNGLINIAVTLGYMVCCLALELSFGYGPVASEQLQLGHIALYLGGLGTCLLNFSLDTNSSTTKHIGLAIMCCWTVWFGYLLSSIVFLLVAFSALSAIFKFPQFSCQVGSWASTLGIFVWWIMLRLRPGNPPMSVFDGYEFFAVALLIVYKLNIRRLLAVRSLENIVLGIWVENVSIFVEKAAFCLWGYYLLFVYPAKENNFFFDTFLCWSHPAMPSFSLNLYYLVNMASCIEDVVWWITSGASTPRYFSSMTPSDYRNGRDRDAFDNKLIGLYHILTSMFLIGSYYSDHVKIGTILLFIHHVSDCVHYLWRMGQALPVSMVQSGLLILNILTWFVCRGYLMITIVMYSVLFESKSFRFDTDCIPGECSWIETIERVPLLAVLVNILFVNSIWLIVLSLKWYEQVPCQKKSTVASNATISNNTSTNSNNTVEVGIDCGVSTCIRWSNNPLSALLLRHR